MVRSIGTSSLLRQDLMISQNARFLDPLHETLQPFRALDPFINRFYTARDQFEKRLVQPQSQIFDKARTYFIPGFLNHSPHPEFLRQISKASEHGLAFVSVSEQTHYFDNQGYTMIGGTSKVYQPDWRLELATVVQRLYVDLKELEAKGESPERLIFIGHSKGGLLAHSLAAYAKQDKLGDRARLHDFYPNMNEVPDEVLTEVLRYLEGAFYLSIGSPHDGIDERTLKTAKRFGFDRFFAGSSHYYSSDFLEALYDDIDLQPDDSEHGIHGAITAQPFHGESHPLRNFLKRASMRHEPNLRSLFYHGGHSMFDLGAILLGGDMEHDALVGAQKRDFDASLHLKGHNHVTMVGDQAADAVIEFIQKHRV